MEKMFQKHPDMFDTFSNREHLTFDTTNTTPKEAAEKIVNYYKLI